MIQPIAFGLILLFIGIGLACAQGRSSSHRTRRLIAGGLSDSATPRAQPDDSLCYAVLRRGTAAARTCAWTDHTGVAIVHTRFYPDTSRVIITRLRYDPSATAPTSLETSGVDRDGRTAREYFEIVNGVAAWRGTQSGQKPYTRGVAYLPATAHARWQAILPTLLAADGAVAVLPRGQLRVTREGSFVVTSSAGERRITQYAVQGMAPLMSDRVWVDSSGRLFADGESVVEGWEGVLPALRDSARASRAAEHRAYVRTLRRLPGRPVAIRHARLFDAGARALRESMTVLVRDSTIAAVGHDTAVHIPRGAELIDAHGRMLLPGLWDMHSHDACDVPALMWHLAAGVTTIRDMVRDTLTALCITERPEDAVAFAPNVFWAGVLDGVGAARGVVVSESSVRMLVRRYAQMGASQIKLYGRLRPELVPAAAEEARRLGLRVGGHLAFGMTAEAAIIAGYNEISHMPFLSARSDSAYLGPALWRGLANAARLDVESDSVRQLIEMLRTRNVAIDPTLAFVEPSARTPTLVIRRDVAPVLNRLPAGPAQALVGWDMLLPHDSLAETATRGFANLRAFVQALFRAGVTLLPGTDFLGGFTLQRELELYVESGIPPALVLHMATLGAARVMGVDAVMGSIDVGKRADMILIDGDPMRDMADIRRVVMTMKGGALYDPLLLYRALAIQPCCAAARDP